MSKEKPILFSTAMVQKIKCGQKTQTRRVVKIPSWTWDKYDDLQLDKHGNLLAVTRKAKQLAIIEAPYAVGDILWVRETWGIGIQLAGGIAYKADYVDKDYSPLADGETWKPSIHMPKGVARIFLKVTGVRAERLQDITIGDCMKEGADYGRVFKGALGDESVQEGKYWNMLYIPRIFEKLWDSLNADRGYGWAANPWVWVVEFEAVEARG